MHDVLNRTFEGRLLFPPLSRPRRILECGYGAASWASEVAEQNPRCEVCRTVSLFSSYTGMSQSKTTRRIETIVLVVLIAVHKKLGPLVRRPGSEDFSSHRPSQNLNEQATKMWNHHRL
jgi:hypothetical protein